MGKRELKLVDPRQPSDAKLRRMGEIVRERMRLEAEAREAEEAARIEAEAAAEAAAQALANGNGCKKEDEEAEEVEVKEEEKEEEKEAEEEIDDAKLEAMREELEDLQQQKHQLFVKLKRVLKEEEKEKQEKKAAEEAKAAEAERQEQRRLAEEKRCPWRPHPSPPLPPCRPAAYAGRPAPRGAKTMDVCKASDRKHHTRCGSLRGALFVLHQFGQALLQPLARLGRAALRRGDLEGG